MLKIWLAIFNFVLLADSGDLTLPAVDLKRVTGNETVTVADQITLELEGAQDVQSLIVDEDMKKQWVDSGIAVIPPDSVTQPYRLTVIPLKAGELTVPSLFFKNSKAQTFLRSNPFTFNAVEFKSSDKTPPPDLIGPVALRFPREFFILLGALAVLILVTVYFEWKDYLKKKHQSRAHSKKIKLPEDEEAFVRLSELEKSEEYKKFVYKKIYFSISEIIKQYLGARYKFDGLESTSREVIVALENNGLGVALVKEFEELFKKLDLIKFTDTVADQENTRQILVQVRKLVDLTKKPKVAINPEVMHEVR